MAASLLPIPDDFRQRVRAAAGAADQVDRAEQLAQLAQFNLGFLETILLDNALRQCRGEVPGFTQVRIAILAACTIDHLLPAIRVAGLRRRLLIDLYKGSFGQYRQELLCPGAELIAFRPEIVLLSLTTRDILSTVPLRATAAEAEAGIADAVQGLRELWSTAQRSLNASVIQQSFLDVSVPLFGSFDRLVPGAPSRLAAKLNERVADAASADGALLLDIARESARDGIDAWFDVARWLQGKIEIAPQSALAYGELLARLIAAQRGQSKKCLVLDLDNTLWGGVIGDDGLDGIVLGEGHALGEAHLALQHYAKALNERGIILAVCSKNDMATAESVFREHPEMLLKRSDIAAFVANWNDKAANLKLIAEQLNIGLDSLVFVDDNPAERARVREALPMVAVPELPKDPAHFVRCIGDAGYFEAVAFTDDDRERSGQYAANVERDALRSASQSMETFLRGLDMSVAFGPVTSVDLTRATQLINKTNQFNATTRRYTADEVSRLVTAPENLAFQFRLVDRFGDNGLVSVMILRSLDEDIYGFEVDTWVMSCRVFGRQLEFEAMNLAVEAIRDRGIRFLRVDYMPTKKNGIISELFGELGFSRQQTLALPGTAIRWVLDIEKYIPRRTFIARRAQ